jgi:hypothetical protein
MPADTNDHQAPRGEPAGPEGAGPEGRAQYLEEEARKAYAKRDEARREAAAARELAEKATAEAAACQELLAELVERKLAGVPPKHRRLVPENLPAAERLRYLIEHEALLAAPPGAAVPGPEKPPGLRDGGPAFEQMSSVELKELCRSDPGRYRRVADDYLRRRALRGSPQTPN